MSGNGPLVEVLREALAADEHARAKELGQAGTKTDAARKVKSFIQNIHHFRDANLQSANAPIERVAVFDEAQRAWDKDKAGNFMAQRKGVPDFDQSEPEFLISVMDRHADWCTIVCLIGGGQEINAGEAGLNEWFSALKRRFPGWRIYSSPQLAATTPFEVMPSGRIWNGEIPTKNSTFSCTSNFPTPFLRSQPSCAIWLVRQRGRTDAYSRVLKARKCLAFTAPTPGPLCSPPESITMSGLLMMQESEQMKSAAKVPGGTALPRDKFRTTSS